MSGTLDAIGNDTTSRGVRSVFNPVFLGVIDNLRAEDTSRAASNTATIQSALSSSGIAYVAAPGIYYLADTLTYVAGATLKLCPGAYLRTTTNGEITTARRMIAGVDGIVRADVPIIDRVTATATAFLRSQGGVLKSLLVLSGSNITVQLTDALLTSGGRALGTFAGLNAGDTIPLPFDGLVFIQGLYMTLTGTATIVVEVA